MNRPNRQLRRSRGKSDTVDAEAAARAVLAGTATSTPKARDGIVESVRVLRLTARTTRHAMCQSDAQILHLIVTAPEPPTEQPVEMNISCFPISPCDSGYLLCAPGCRASDFVAGQLSQS